MTLDVYSGDHDLDAAATVTPSTRITRIAIRADADPDVLLRIAAILNTLNAAPQEVHLRRVSVDIAAVDVVLRGCAQIASDRLCRKLRQLTCVWSVKSVSSKET